MTPGQWEQIVAKVESAWGFSAKWKNAVAMYDRARNVDHVAAGKAVDAFVDAGDGYAPSIPELLKRARGFQKPRAVDQRSCDHQPTVVDGRQYSAWAVVESTFEYDVGVCRLCGCEKRFPPGRLNTESEVVA